MIIYACLWKKISYRFSFPVVLYLGTSPLCRRKWRNKWWCLFPTSFWNIVKRVWRYQRSNQNPYIEEKQTTQWPKEKVRKNKQRSRNHTYKTKDRVTRTPLKTGGELMCSGRVTSSCSISGTRRIKLVTNLVISREWGKDGEVFTTSVDIYGSLSVASWKTGASHTNKKY